MTKSKETLIVREGSRARSVHPDDKDGGDAGTPVQRRRTPTKSKHSEDDGGSTAEENEDTTEDENEGSQRERRISNGGTQPGARYDVPQTTGKLPSIYKGKAHDFLRSRGISDDENSELTPESKGRLLVRVMSTTVTSIVVVCLFAFMAARYFSTNQIDSNSKVTPSNWEHAQHKLLQEIRASQKRFPKQEKDTMIHLLAALNSTLSNTVPRQPSSIVILVPPDYERSSFPNCFAEYYARVMNNIFSGLENEPDKSSPRHPVPVLQIDSNFLRSFEDNISGVHRSIRKYFESGGKSVVVRDVEKIGKEEHLLIFHSLCDNYAAPETRATFLFLVPVPKHFYEKIQWNYDGASDISYNVLDAAWKSISSDDSRPATIARVAATVLLLQKGDYC